MGCREVYIAQLDRGVNKHTENIEIHGKGLGMYATLFRYGKPLVDFYPSKSQITKIKKGKGNVRISSCQISRASTFKQYRR